MCITRSHLPLLRKSKGLNYLDKYIFYCLLHDFINAFENANTRVLFTYVICRTYLMRNSQPGTTQLYYTSYVTTVIFITHSISRLLYVVITYMAYNIKCSTPLKCRFLPVFSDSTFFREWGEGIEYVYPKCSYTAVGH